ncbi:MAG: DUF1223 domain-containing protein [Caulobacteraceae bacterium]|nr:DUF1223 domain-containing protein [Caulobacteraceae bacterium]
MRLIAFATLVLALLTTPAAAARQPVVVELYTAQGCAACGPANAFVGKLADRKGVLALMFPVDYWDYLGWADTFAKPEFAVRQKAYLPVLNLREAYTPQVIVDGRAQATGAQPEKIESLIRSAARASRNPPDMLFQPRRVLVGSGPNPPGGADVWLIRYDPAEQMVEVRRGENRGENILHRNVVRQIERLGAWRGRPSAYRLPPAPEEGLETVVLVQQTRTGRMLSVLQD